MCVCVYVSLTLVLGPQRPPEVIVASTDPKDIVDKEEGDGKGVQAPRRIQTPSLHSSPSLKRLSSTTLMDLASSDEEDAASRQPQGQH